MAIKELNRLKLVLVKKKDGKMACGTDWKRSNNSFKVVY